MSRDKNSSLSDFLAARTSARPILLTGGAVVTMDPLVPALHSGDVIIVGSRIIAIGADLHSAPEHAAAVSSALVVDT